MKKIIVALLMMLPMVFSINANAQRYNGSELFWRLLDKKTLMLEKYGSYQNGREVTVVQNTTGESVTFVTTEGVHFMEWNYTHDGNTACTFTYSGDTIILRNRFNTDYEGSPIDRNYQNRMKMHWIELKNGSITIFTTDSFGTYRYYTVWY